MPFSLALSSEPVERSKMPKVPLRFCLVNPVKSVEFLYDKQLRRYVAEGVGSQLMDAQLDMMEPIYNFTEFHSSIDDEVCYQRINHNLSDFTTHLTLIHKNLEANYSVPTPSMASKLVFITGYNASEYENMVNERDIGTAMSNFGNFHHSIYTLTLIYLFITCILVVLRHRILYRRSRRTTMARAIMKKILQFLSAGKFGNRFINILNSFLFFVILTLFLVLYKTSQVVIDPPTIIKEYKQLLALPNTAMVFHDTVYACSDEFRDSPVDSMKGKLWTKNLEMTRRFQVNKDGFVLKSSNLFNIKFIRDTYAAVVRRGLVMVTTHQLSIIVRNIGCSLCPDDEQWKLVTSHDHSEAESLTGCALRNGFPHLKEFISSRRRLVESHLMYKIFDRIAEQSRFIYSVTQGRRLRQFFLCQKDDSISADTVYHMKAIDLLYYEFLLKLYFQFLTSLLLFNLIKVWLTSKGCKGPKKDKSRTRGLQSIVQIIY